MKRTHVVVLWAAGLHLRPAAQLLKVARGYSATILLRCGDRVADVRNILGVVALCAAVGTVLVLETSGEDEQAAARHIEQVFAGGHTHG